MLIEWDKNNSATQKCEIWPMENIWKVRNFLLYLVCAHVRPEYHRSWQAGTRQR